MGRAPLLVLCHIIIAASLNHKVIFHFYSLQTKHSEQTRSHLAATPPPSPALSNTHAHINSVQELCLFFALTRNFIITTHNSGAPLISLIYH